MTRVLCTSSVAGAALLAAAVDAGLIGPGRRVLIVANEAVTPEVVPDPTAATGFAAIAARFEDVVSWNDLVAPLHPSAWSPPARELPVLGRLLAARLSGSPGRGEPIDELVVESVTDGPGRTLAALVPDPPITIATPTTTVYAPAFADASTEVSERVVRLLHVDLLPVVAARLRVHDGVDVAAVPPAALRCVLPAAPSVTADAVLLGERWAELGASSADAETRLRVETLRALAGGGHTDIVFAPHPASGPTDQAPLLAAAVEFGVHLTIGAAGVPHEQWTGDGALIVGTRASALLAAAQHAVSGAYQVLDGLGRFDNPLRMPLVLADASLPHLDPDGGIRPARDLDLAHLADTVAYCLVPGAVPELRARAVDYVASHGSAPYLHRGRLVELAIPIPRAPQPSAPAPSWC